MRRPVAATDPHPRSAGGTDGARRAARLQPDEPALNVLRPRRQYSRWRAMSLGMVYVLFTAHIIHWKLAGKTLAPLEINEVMYTFELGIITAGFIFMCVAFLGTMIFGRFLCSWGCHIMALQDLCAYLLGKLGLRPKPVRSRLLLWVAPFTALYMFAWPQVARILQGRPLPKLHFATDAQGWASFETTNFWRNLPGPGMIALTFLVCGFVIVYVLGSRGFCTYVCPYGAAFGLADRFAPGRIRVNDACKQCGRCTAACTSHIRVHEETARFGTVVNPACMKDFDCISACPEGALRYGFGKPSLWRAWKTSRFGVPYDFTIGEELLAAGVFLVILFVFRGLYGLIPFLLALALGGIGGYLTVVFTRLWRRPNVGVASWVLKTRGRLTVSGVLFGVVFLMLTAFTAHSGLIRYHEYHGRAAFTRMEHAAGPAEATAAAREVRSHLAFADTWGLMHAEPTRTALLDACLRLDDYRQAAPIATLLARRHPDRPELRLKLGRCLTHTGNLRGAEAELRAAITLAQGLDETDPQHADILANAHQMLGELFARTRRFDDASTQLREAIRIDPTRATAQAALGSVEAELGRLDDAVIRLREAVRLAPDLAEAHYNLGTIYAHTNRYRQAVDCFRRALELTPNDPDAKRNLAYTLKQLTRTADGNTPSTDG